jgi:hypothetical protein
MSGAIQQTVDLLNIHLVGEWRKEGGKVKCVDKKKLDLELTDTISQYRNRNQKTGLVTQRA